MPEKCVEKVERELISQPGFNPESIRSKSSAAAGLCGWVINICKYFRIYQVRAGRGFVWLCLDVMPVLIWVWSRGICTPGPAL